VYATPTIARPANVRTIRDRIIARFMFRSG
jgi:hypothetical protein